MKKFLFVMCCVFCLSGCAKTTSQATPAAQEKAVVTTLEGTISKSGGKFFITSSGKPSTELDSYTVKLDQYVGKKASVSGQYSGTTLFVDTITME